MTVASISMATIMFLFELAKDILLGDISLWTSHSITIMFSTIVAGSISYLVSFKLNRTSVYKLQCRELEAKKNELELLNCELIRAKEKAEESDRLKSAFISNLSHEIRTPLNGINGFTSLLSRNNISDNKQRIYQNEIAKSSDALLDLIDNVIEYSKAETQELLIIKKRFCACEPIDAVLTQYNETLEKKPKLTVATEIESISVILFNDKSKTIKVLYNLLSNAVKFTQEGSVKIGVKLQTDLNRVLYYIKDSGTGIDENTMPYIFKPFRQGDDSATRKHSGLGMGLAVAQKLVEAMGGTIWADSKPGEGACFYFSLPI